MMKGLHFILTFIMMLSSVEAGFEDDSEHFRKESQRARAYTKKFIDLLLSRSFQASEMGGEIVRIIWKSGVDASFDGEGQCHQRLLHIFKHELNCSGVANKLVPQLQSIDIANSMMRNEKLYNSLMVYQNCTKLKGSTYKMCRNVLENGLTPQTYMQSDINIELEHCFREEKVNSNHLLTKR